MAKSETTIEKTDAPVMEEKKADVPAAAPQQAQRQSFQIEVNDTNATACYANFCRVTGSPEELIVDFGLNPQPIGVPKDPIDVKQRIIMNYYTAKRLLGALNMSIQRHESVFGVLETDINKRLKLPQRQ